MQMIPVLRCALSRPFRTAGFALSFAPFLLGGGLLGGGLLARRVRAQDQDPVTEQPKIDYDELLRRLDEQEQLLRELAEREKGRDEAVAAATAAAAAVEPPKFEVLYKNGFIMRSTKDAATPFELRINGRMQLRYTGFAVADDTYANLETRASTSGAPINVSKLNEFEIERGRLEFRGMWLDPNLHFYMNIDSDTDDNHQLIFQDFWVNYEFDPAFDLYVGKAFVPGSRSWLDGSTRTHLADRSMATSYFRPDRTIGIWAIGELFEDFYYRAMLGNGLSTADLTPAQENTKFAYAASIWYDPFAPFGAGYADLEHHEDLAGRVGLSFAYGEQSGTTSTGASLAESQFLRLSDGSRLTALGVTEFDEYLAAADAAFKFQGFSINGEAYYRWIRNIDPTGAAPAGFPDDKQEDWGFYVDAGFFLVEKRLEPVVRVSCVQGSQKDSVEYAGGLNYYVDGTHNNKFTLEAAWLDGSPVSNSGANYRVGDDGVRVMLQWQIAF